MIDADGACRCMASPSSFCCMFSTVKAVYLSLFFGLPNAMLVPVGVSCCESSLVGALSDGCCQTAN